MKPVLLSFFLLLTIVSCLHAQEDEYVISNPKKINKSNIKPSQVDSFKKKNPDYTAYFLNPTAYTLKKKQIRASGTNILFMKGSYGLTNNTTASVNISLFGTLTGSLKQQIGVNEMVRVGISASGGMLVLNPAAPTIHSDRDSNIFLMGAQAMITLGDKQDNLTAGTGYYLLKGTYDFAKNGTENYSINLVYIGFQKQISKKLYLMGEGMYFINNQIFTGGLGVKAVIGDRIALNFGVMPLGFNDPSTRQVSIPLALPIISFRMLLGRK